MPFEIDVLAVGEGSKGGDAIALRFGPDLTRQDLHRVVIIDGGSQSSGEALVRHVWDHYGSETVDLVLNTHPDIDHVSGLHAVLEHLRVGQLAMHRPWMHAAQVRWTFRDGRLTDAGLSDNLRRSVEAAYSLEQAASASCIPVIEPFAGNSLTIGRDGLYVLGPTLDYYERLLCDFRDTPAARFPGLLGIGATTVQKSCKWCTETLDPETETLADDGQTSAENNSSVVSLLHVDGLRILFTADAGIPALDRALAFAAMHGLDFVQSPLFLIQVPHHGSRRNVGPSVLNRVRAQRAVISAPPTSDKHPSPKVVNALIRRGVQVHSTRGTTICYAVGARPRPGWSAVAPHSFTPVFAE